MSQGIAGHKDDAVCSNIELTRFKALLDEWVFAVNEIRRIIEIDQTTEGVLKPTVFSVIAHLCDVPMASQSGGQSF